MTTTTTITAKAPTKLRLSRSGRAFLIEIETLDDPAHPYHHRNNQYHTSAIYERRSLPDALEVFKLLVNIVHTGGMPFLGVIDLPGVPIQHLERLRDNLPPGSTAHVRFVGHPALNPTPATTQP